MIEKQNSNKWLMISFHITDYCGLNCAYCFESGKQSFEVMKLECAKKFIDLILAEDDHLGLKGTKLEYLIDATMMFRFFGGDAFSEPELCDEIMQYLDSQMQKLNHKWLNNHKIYMPTNGIFFDDDKVKKFIDKYKDKLVIQISIDGCPELQKKTRPGSMDKILESWEWFTKYYTENMGCVFTRSVYSSESIQHLPESIKFLHEDLKIKYIGGCLPYEGMKKVDYQELDSQLSRVADYALEHCDDLFIEELLSFDSYGKRCLPGKVLTLMPDGKIYPCHKFVPYKSYKFDYCIGDVYTGFYNKEKLVELREKIKQEKVDDVCKQCNINDACSFYCVGDVYMSTGKFWKLPECGVKQILDRHRRKYWNELWKRNSIKSFFPDVDYSKCKEKIKWEKLRAQK